jgi:LmbE family N-acetylglucosaminyl deacetylase
VISVYPLLIVFFSGLLSASLAGKATLHRRFRQPVELRRLAIAVAAVLLVANLLAFYFDLKDFWESADLTVAVAGMSALGIAMYLLRIRPAPASTPRRVLAIGAHPDDLELACGGTLAKIVDSGHEVEIVVMCDGRRGGDGKARRGDAVRGASYIGLTQMRHYDFADANLAAYEQEMVQVIEGALARFSPDIILTHSQHDSHQDHQAVHAATLRAARAHHSILCFESPSATRDFDPSFFVDIEDYMEAKVEAVRMHSDQREKPYMAAERLRGVAIFRGAQARRRVAEAYEPVRMLSSDLGSFEARIFSNVATAE